MSCRNAAAQVIHRRDDQPRDRDVGGHLPVKEELLRVVERLADAARADHAHDRRRAHVPFQAKQRMDRERRDGQRNDMRNPATASGRAPVAAMECTGSVRMFSKDSAYNLPNDPVPCRASAMMPASGPVPMMLTSTKSPNQFREPLAKLPAARRMGSEIQGGTKFRAAAKPKGSAPSIAKNVPPSAISAVSSKSFGSFIDGRMRQAGRKHPGECGHGMRERQHAGPVLPECDRSEREAKNKRLGFCLTQRAPTSMTAISAISSRIMVVARR